MGRVVDDEAGPGGVDADFAISASNGTVWDVVPRRNTLFGHLLVALEVERGAVKRKDPKTAKAQRREMQIGK